MSSEEKQRILDTLREGCGLAKCSIVNVKASDVLALIELIDELQGKPKESKAK